MRSIFLAAAAAAVLSGSAFAGEDAFTKGPVFNDYGPVANVEADFAIPDGAVLKHSFDVSKQAEEGALNRTLISAARFINMHARAGLAPDNIHVAVVVHGSAVKDVASESGNANEALIAALTEQGVRVIVCGQSAAYYDLGADDLLPGVEMALSAMTAHALLQQEGYTINPF